MQLFLIYLFLQTLLHMFQAVPPPIIRSTQLYIQLQVLSTNTAASCYRGGDGTYQETLHLVGCNLELYYDARTYEYKKLNAVSCAAVRTAFPRGKCSP
jgi:hypothetical protein